MNNMKKVNRVKVNRVKEYTPFWSVSDNGRIFIDHRKYIRFLEENGYAQHFDDDDNMKLVRVISDDITYETVDSLKIFLLKFFKTQNADEMWNMVYINEYYDEDMDLFNSKLLYQLDLTDQSNPKRITPNTYKPKSPYANA